jgi:hypothetical protein
VQEFAERLESAGRAEGRALVRTTQESYALPKPKSFKIKDQQASTHSQPEESDYE